MEKILAHEEEEIETEVYPSRRIRKVFGVSSSCQLVLWTFLRYVAAFIRKQYYHSRYSFAVHVGGLLVRKFSLDDRVRSN